MGTESNRQARRNRRLRGAGWAASVGITLVEMQFGVDYVLSHVAGHLSAFVGWLPIVGTLVKQFWA